MESRLKLLARVPKKVKIDTDPNGTGGDLRRHLRLALAKQQFDMK